MILKFIFFLIISIIGNLLATYINGFIVSRQLSKQIFKKSDFEKIDNDFFSSSSSSITDVNIESDGDKNDNKQFPTFF